MKVRLKKEIFSRILTNDIIYEVVIFEIMFSNNNDLNIYILDDSGILIIQNLNDFDIIESIIREDITIVSNQNILWLVPKEISYPGFLDDLHSGDRYQTPLVLLKKLFPNEKFWNN